LKMNLSSWAGVFMTEDPAVQRFGEIVGIIRKQLLGVIGLVAVVIPVAFGLVGTSQGRAQSQTKNEPVIAPDYKYEVISIKPRKSGDIAYHLSLNNLETPDGFSATSVTLQTLIRQAFGAGLGYSFDDGRVSEAPNWLNSETYDVQAKMDSAIAEQLQKLGPDQRRLARQQMLQALLTDRLNLKIHHESKELPVYWLVTAKDGPKLQESKAPDSDSNEGKDSRSEGSGRAPGEPLPFHHSQIATLARFLSGQLRRPVLDKTGLTGKYDFTLQWARGESQTDSNGPSLFTAVQEQLGLKLEAKKSPSEIIVIDHVERPSGN
jgi:uncharacterized protein (TIGR03435 family)